MAFIQENSTFNAPKVELRFVTNVIPEYSNSNTKSSAEEFANEWWVIKGQYNLSN